MSHETTLENWLDVDLCSTCVYFVAYGTTGDASATREPSAEQKRTDLDHAALMFNTLGVIPAFYENPDDVDGSFSHSGCEGCGRQECHVYTGTLIFDNREMMA